MKNRTIKEKTGSIIDTRHTKVRTIVSFVLDGEKFNSTYFVPSLDTLIEYEAAGFRWWWLPSWITGPLIARRSRRKYKRYRLFIEKLYHI